MRGPTESYPSPVRDKYHFRSLDIGESMELERIDPARVRTAATMYGTRYGVWLLVHKTGTDTATVTRVEAPPVRKKVIGDNHRDEGIRKLHDAVATLTGMFLKVQRSVDSIERQLEEKL